MAIFLKLIVVGLAVLGAITLGKVIFEPFQYFNNVSSSWYTAIYFVVFTFIIALMTGSIVFVIVDMLEND